MSVRRYVLAAAAVAAAVVTANPAVAQSTESMLVQHADLDLNSASGARTFEMRVNAAARRVCGSHYVREIQNRFNVSECEAAAREQAMRQRAALAANGNSAGTIRAAR